MQILQKKTVLNVAGTFCPFTYRNFDLIFLLRSNVSQL